MIVNVFKKAALLSSLLFAGISSGQAQTFVPPSAYEFTYNGPYAQYSGDISAFAFNNRLGNTAWGEVDVYLAGRGFGVSEVSVQFTAPNDPTNILYQGYFRYDDASYFQVGAVYNESTGTMQILVAYQWAGFHIDIYDITTSATDPVVLNSTITLVPWAFNTDYFYNRIRMDSHSLDLNKVAIVWDNPYIGLQAIACEAGHWGNILNIGNTTGESGPDIAFTQNATANPEVNIVHHNASGTAITTSSIDFNTLMTATGTVYPSIEDVNNITVPIQSNLVLDGPDLTDGAHVWAYTYTDQNNQEVFVRHMNDNFSPTANTISVNSGVLGNASISGQYNAFSPSLHYGNNYAGIGENIVVGWYNTDGIYNGYIALKMSTDPYAPTLVSDPDYLELPNAMTPGSPYPIINNYRQPGIAFSKGDVGYTPRHLYAAYYDVDNASGLHQLHHAFHDWGMTTFKKEIELNIGQEAEVYPNPFTDVLNASVTLEEKGTVRLELTDVTGRIVAWQETEAEKGTYPVQLSGLQSIVSGTYFMSTSVDGKKVNTRMVVKQ